MQRRDFLVSAAIAPGLALVPGGADAQGMTVVGPQSRPAPAVATAGSFGTQLELLGDFRVVERYEVFHGAIPFVLEGEGERFQLDVMRRADAGAAGVHASEHFTFFVHGAGSPAQERGARALGLALDRAVRSGATMPTLASFEERARDANGAELHVDFARMTDSPQTSSV
jgi:hypothetical protein